MAKATHNPVSNIPQSLWIYNPALDLIVGCGAWSAPLLLFAYSAGASNTLSWSIAFYGLALFFNYPHYMATLYRAYHSAEDFRKYRIFTVHITAVVALTLLLSHGSGRSRTSLRCISPGARGITADKITDCS